MNIQALPLVIIFSAVVVKGQDCPNLCTCEKAALSDLPIHSVFLNSKHNAPSEHDLPSYKHRNEVLDEADERVTEEKIVEEVLKTATCVLSPSDSLPLFLSLPVDLQALVILQGAGTANITLDKTYFEHLQKLIVLEIHGFQHESSGTLRLKNDALKDLQLLKYLNVQYVHLQGERGVGNQPAPVSELNFRESGLRYSPDTDEDSNTIPSTIKFVTQEEVDIVPYDIYKEQQERAGLSSFAGLQNLIFLRTFHCNIKEVNWEMFNGLQNLQYLSLEGNKIPFLHEFSFYGTPNLKHLTLSHNKLLNIQSTSLAGLLKLEMLDLSYNNITHLSEFSLPPFPQLKVADFHHNPLELILPHTFYVMNNTEYLYLGGKSAQLEIRPNSFLGLDKVLKMSLNNVFVTMLEREHLTGMPNLKELKIEGVIDHISFDAFLDVSKLHVLILRHCSIKKVSMDAFFGLYGLIYLDISHNELETLPPSLFDQQGSLKEIILHHNKLTTLPEGLFLHTQAKLIRLDKNPWHCSCAMSEWQPAQINKVKEKVIDDSLCQTRYDKGSMCSVQYKYQYTYDQSVSPRCATPTRFSGWSVFHMLRKHLVCPHNTHKHKKGVVKVKHTKTHNTTTPANHDSVSAIVTPGASNKTIVDLKNNNTFEITTSVHELSLASETTPGGLVPDLILTQENELNPINPLPANQYLWTDKDRRKYKLLQEKDEGRISMKQNFTEASTPEVSQGELDSANSQNKDLKKSSAQTKWQLKMENTIRKLNKVPTKK